MIPLMADKSSIQTLFQHDPQGLVQSVIHIDRCRVVIGAVAAPVVLHHLHVQVPALHFGLAGIDRGDRPVAECHRCQTGWTTEALLGSAVDRIKAPFIDFHRLAAERRDAIHRDQHVVFVADPRQIRHRLRRSRRGLGVHNPQHLGSMLLHGGFNLLGREDLAKRSLQLDHLGPTATGDIGHATAEHAVDADDHLVARLDQVGDNRLHPRAAGPADGQCHLVLRAKDLPQHRLCFIHDLQEVRIEMPDRRCRHREQHAGMNIAGAGAHQNPSRRSHRTGNEVCHESLAMEYVGQVSYLSVTKIGRNG